MTVTDSTAAPSSDQPLLGLLSGFIMELRNAGLPVSLTENLDAMEAVTHIPIEDREAFKYALGATLVKNHSHWRAFEVVFEVVFLLYRDINAPSDCHGVASERPHSMWTDTGRDVPCARRVRPARGGCPARSASSRAHGQAIG